MGEMLALNYVGRFTPCEKKPPIFAGMTVGGITTRNTFAILPLILSQLREKKSHNRKDSPLLLAKKTSSLVTAGGQYEKVGRYRALFRGIAGKKKFCFLRREKKELSPDS